MKNQTPLHYAAENNLKEIGKLLISKGADINSEDIFLNSYKNIFLNQFNFKLLKEIK